MRSACISRRYVYCALIEYFLRDLKSVLCFTECPLVIQRTILDLLKSDNDNVLLRQYMARLLNTFSSLCEGS